MQKRYLGPEEEAAILSLREEGKEQKDIAKQFGVCQATISNVINGRHKVRGKRNSRQAYLPPRPPCEPEPPTPNFSELPDHVLFKHVNAFDFIG